MSTLRDTVARVAAEMRAAPPAYRSDRYCWADDLTAALDADAEADAVCLWQVDEAGVTHCTGCGQLTVADPEKYCPFCGQKVKVTP